MKKGQTSIRNSIQDLLCPFEYFGISQGVNVGTHKGTMANDIGYKDTKAPYEPYYAPCDVKCVWVYPSNGQTMWQSVNKVRFADGSIDYITFLTAHDNSLSATVGKKLKQGDLMGHKGNKGASGIHCHIQCAKGLRPVSDWHLNEYKVYCFNNEVNIDSVFFFDNTELAKNSIPNDYYLKYLKDVIVEDLKPEPKPIPAPEPVIRTLKVGDRVKIVATGNGSSMGTANTAYGIGWERQILKIWEGRLYPYQVGNNTGTTGFYKVDALQKI